MKFQGATQLTDSIADYADPWRMIQISQRKEICFLSVFNFCVVATIAKRVSGVIDILNSNIIITKM